MCEGTEFLGLNSKPATHVSGAGYPADSGFRTLDLLPHWRKYKRMAHALLLANKI